MSLLELQYYKNMLINEKKRIINKDYNKIKKYEKMIRLFEEKKARIEEEEKNENIVYIYDNHKYIPDLNKDEYKIFIENNKNRIINDNLFKLLLIIYEKSMFNNELINTGYICLNLEIDCTVNDIQNELQKKYEFAKFRLILYNYETKRILKNDTKIKLYSKGNNSVFTIGLNLLQKKYLYVDREDIIFLLRKINKLEGEINKLKNGDNIVEAELIQKSDKYSEIKMAQKAEYI